MKARWLVLLALAAGCVAPAPHTGTGEVDAPGAAPLSEHAEDRPGPPAAGHEDEEGRGRGGEACSGTSVSVASSGSCRPGRP